MELPIPRIAWWDLRLTGRKTCPKFPFTTRCAFWLFCDTREESMQKHVYGMRANYYCGLDLVLNDEEMMVAWSIAAPGGNNIFSTRGEMLATQL